jgi:Holliday junction resolvase
MRRQNRRDLNQKRLAAELRQCGFSVADTSRVGDDFPDLVVGKNGIDRLVEVKSGKKVNHRAQELSEGQQKFAREWRGAKVIHAWTLDDVLIEFAKGFT